MNVNGVIKISPKLNKKDAAKFKDFLAGRFDNDKNAPSINCPWSISSDGKQLFWSDISGESYDAVAWIKYLIKTKFAKENRNLRGEVFWQDKEYFQFGKFKVAKCNITVYNGVMKYVKLEV